MEQEEKFKNQLERVVSQKNKNNIYLNQQQYEKILLEVKTAKLKEKNKTYLDYRRLKRYDILVVGQEEKLISPLKEGDSVKYFATIEETYGLIHKAHLATGHGGRNRLVKEISSKYNNITIEAVMLYLSLCKECQKKGKGKKKGIVTKPILMNERNSWCQVDFIDLQTQPDNEFKFILSYQHHLTKFVVLRPLKTKTASEVAKQLMDIFTLLGAPSTLYCDNGREFANKLIKELANMWDVKIMHGKPHNSQSQDSMEQVNQDVQNMLTTWLLSNQTTKWSEGLKYVQLMKNRAFHEGIRQTPYEALFGTRMELGLETSNVPVESVEQLEREEESERLIKHEGSTSKINQNEYTMDTDEDNEGSIDSNSIDTNQNHCDFEFKPEFVDINIPNEQSCNIDIVRELEKIITKAIDMQTKSITSVLKMQTQTMEKLFKAERERLEMIMTSEKESRLQLENKLDRILSKLDSYTLPRIINTESLVNTKSD